MTQVVHETEQVPPDARAASIGTKSSSASMADESYISTYDLDGEPLHKKLLMGFHALIYDPFATDRVRDMACGGANVSRELLEEISSADSEEDSQNNKSADGEIFVAVASEDYFEDSSIESSFGASTKFSRDVSAMSKMLSSICEEGQSRKLGYNEEDDDDDWGDGEELPRKSEHEGEHRDVRQDSEPIVTEAFVHSNKGGYGSKRQIGAKGHGSKRNNSEELLGGSVFVVNEVEFKSVMRMRKKQKKKSGLRLFRLIRAKKGAQKVYEF